MDDWRRHAIYFAPEADAALARLGAAWLGWDAETGAEVVPLAVEGLPVAYGELVAAPRRYGFHATLKPPFRLAEGRSVDALDAETARLAAGIPAFAVRLQPAWIGGFYALVPAEGDVPLAALAAACVTDLDDFRAAPSPGELARRRAAGLDAAEAHNLARWGYPYVLDRFRFHMTLTGPVAEPARPAVAAALAPHLAPVLAAPVTVGAVSRFGEGADGRFRLVRRHRLG